MSLYPVPENAILRTVPEDLLLGRVNVNQFAEGQTLCKDGESIKKVIFPLRGLVSIAIPDGEGRHIEVAMVGNEGVVGLALFCGVEKAPWTAIARIAGEAFVMDAGTFRDCLKASPAFNSAVLRSAYTVMYELARVSLCRGAHTIEKRFARWLLTTSDRARQNAFPLTQEFAARTLGVRTASINVAFVKFNRMGIIHYERSWVTISDKDLLEKAACKCYQLMKLGI